MVDPMIGAIIVGVVCSLLGFVMGFMCCAGCVKAINKAIEIE